MSTVDYHAQCDSLVRLSREDLTGPMGYVWEFEENFHPASAVYPGVKVEDCERAAGHPGQCEAFIDTTGIQYGEISRSHWLRWDRHPNLAEHYAWLTSTDGCDATSPHGYHCVRPADHDEGHVYTCR